MLAGILYVGGAIGVEMIGAYYAKAYGRESFKEAKTLVNNLIFIALEQNTSICTTNNQLKVMFLGEKVNDFAINSDRRSGTTFLHTKQDSNLL